MRLSKRNATYIVEEISKIIGEKINMMDENGIIIASTDADRVGSFHEAAKYLIDKKLQRVMVKSDSEYVGARAGLNLAVNFKEDIVGVIGVTGPCEQVEKYGQILKKMTEILILDQYYKEQKEVDQRIRDRYLDEWLMGKNENITPFFVQQGKRLHIDITIPRRVILIALRHKSKIIGLEEEREIDFAEKRVLKVIQDENDAVFLKNGMEIIGAFPKTEDNELVKIVEKIKKQADHFPDIRFCCGIDTGFEGEGFIHKSVIKAQKALQASLRSQEDEWKFYNDITMEIFQNELSTEIKMEYILRVFKNCSLKEIESYMELLNIFFQAEGSITLTSQRLFIHKNTLQYKLRKIKEKTGYDPRSIRYSSLFYNAIHFYQDVREQFVR